MFAEKIKLGAILCSIFASSVVLAQDANQASQTAKRDARSDLIYRDPSMPISIGDMVKIQQQRATEQFLRQAGFSIDAPTSATSLAPVAQQPTAPIDSLSRSPKPDQTVKLLALYRMPDGIQYADVNIAGNILKVADGYKLDTNATVDKVLEDRIVVSQRSKSNDRRCKNSKRNCPPVILTHNIAVGDQINLGSIK